MRRYRILLLAVVFLVGCAGVQPTARGLPTQPPATAVQTPTLAGPTTGPTERPATPTPPATEAALAAQPTAELTTVNLETRRDSGHLTPATDPAPQRIHFAPGETGVSLSGLLTAWETHSFVLEALAGQDLIIEVSAPQPLRLTVSGADGHILRRGMDGTDHWQTHLHATQDYVLELASTSEQTYYQLDITIPPLAVATASSEAPVYRDGEHDFEVRMPEDLLVGASCPVEGILDGAPIASFRLAEGPYAGTNFLDACITVSVDRSRQTDDVCVATRGPNEKYLGQEEINGVRYNVVSHGGVATGHIYDVISYRALHGAACYDLTLFLHYANIGVYTPGTVAEFDHDTVLAELKDVLYRFRFTGS